MAHRLGSDQSGPSDGGCVIQETKKLKGTLEIRGAPFVALTVSCIDPDTASDQLSLTPTII